MKNPMTTTRDNLVEILRENGGSENFDEIFKQLIQLGEYYLTKYQQ